MKAPRRRRGGKGLPARGLHRPERPLPGVGRGEGPSGLRFHSRGLEAVAGAELDTFYVITEDYLRSGRVEPVREVPGRFPTNPGGEAVFRSLLIQGLVVDRVDSQMTARVLEPATFANFRVEAGGTAAQLTPTAEEIGDC